ncbi:hypothetical protein [Azospirillum halopraeferens]|uniref:hypothetical protein n=1 Tax=Azospirillum halopraeferens TaxID=34010 RepID=UPI0012EB4880|nr:hypothetical protein [Azospirillum halopraeferens]
MLTMDRFKYQWLSVIFPRAAGLPNTRRMPCRVHLPQGRMPVTVIESVTGPQQYYS